MSQRQDRPFSALTIAGADSGGGAGIQADLKTFAAHVPPVAFLRAQIDACFDDFRIGAVKLGMLANAEVIHAVADALARAREPRADVSVPDIA